MLQSTTANSKDGSAEKATDRARADDVGNVTYRVVLCALLLALLEIRTEQGSIKAVKQVNIAQPPSAEEAFEPALKPTNEAA